MTTRNVTITLTETEWERVLQSLEITKAISRYAGNPFGSKYQEWYRLQKRVRGSYGRKKGNET